MTRTQDSEHACLGTRAQVRCALRLPIEPIPAGQNEPSDKHNGRIIHRCLLHRNTLRETQDDAHESYPEKREDVDWRGKTTEVDGAGLIGYLAGEDDLANDRNHIGPIERDGSHAENSLGRIITGQVEQTKQRGDETDQPDGIDGSAAPFVHRTPGARKW